jgi:hypothetical protein
MNSESKFSLLFWIRFMSKSLSQLFYQNSNHINKNYSKEILTKVSIFSFKIKYEKI